MIFRLGNKLYSISIEDNKDIELLKDIMFLNSSCTSEQFNLNTLQLPIYCKNDSYDFIRIHTMNSRTTLDSIEKIGTRVEDTLKGIDILYAFNYTFNFNGEKVFYTDIPVINSNCSIRISSEDSVLEDVLNYLIKSMEEKYLLETFVWTFIGDIQPVYVYPSKNGDRNISIYYKFNNAFSNTGYNNALIIRTDSIKELSTNSRDINVYGELPKGMRDIYYSKNKFPIYCFLEYIGFFNTIITHRRLGLLDFNKSFGLYQLQCKNKAPLGYSRTGIYSITPNQAKEANLFPTAIPHIEILNYMGDVINLIIERGVFYDN